MNLGEKIKIIRKEKKLTQKQLGELIGKSEISVRKYEANGNIPLEVILDIAKALDIDVAGLIPGVDNKVENSFKKYLESKNYFIEDIELLEEIESHILEYLKFKLYENSNKNKSD